MRESIVKFAGQRAAKPNASRAGEQKRRIESDHLFQGKSAIVIVHQDEEYYLRITRNGKLILTK
jgi:hemin uptake protein HemP